MFGLFSTEINSVEVKLFKYLMPSINYKIQVIFFHYNLNYLMNMRKYTISTYFAKNILFMYLLLMTNKHEIQVKFTQVSQIIKNVFKSILIR